MTGAVQADRVRRSVLFGLFFLSGAAALVYQTAWHRLLGLFAGADTIAAALVVGAFLLGLGIGSLVAGLLADHLSRRHLRRGVRGFALADLPNGLLAAVPVEGRGQRDRGLGQVDRLALWPQH